VTPKPRESVKGHDESVYHRPPAGITNLRLGVVVAAILLALAYLAFAKSVPFVTGEYQITAVFENAATVRTDSPVRIAGVNVGAVTGLERNGETAEVTFTVSEAGRPIREDATVKIRPRLFLEGNVFLELRPGSPSEAELPDGGTIPITRTAVAVQLDEVLTTLQRPDRRSLQILLEELGDTLTHKPTAAEDAGQDPDVRGESAATAIHDSFRYGGRALRDAAQVTEALQGTEPHDLSKLIVGLQRTFRGLARSETQLSELVTNLNVTTGALAAESENLSLTIAELAPTLEIARPALVRLNRVFPPLRRFSGALEPSIRELPATIDAGRPWLRQAKPLLGDSELGGIARFLRDGTPGLARTTHDAGGLFTQVGRTGRCLSDVLVPALSAVFDRADDPFKTGLENYKEFFFGVVQQSGESQNFDGNGQAIRVQVGGGSQRVRGENPKGGFQSEFLWGNTIEPPIGTQPQTPSSLPPIREDVKCHTNDVPDLNGPAAEVGDPSPAAVAP
jgi:ABC-type transporter Mla subunit MlaD